MDQTTKNPEPREAKIISRVFIKDDGDLIVTDLWEEMEALLTGSNNTTEGQSCQI